MGVGVGGGFILGLGEEKLLSRCGCFGGGGGGLDL